MTQWDKQVHEARGRLWMNGWLNRLSWCLALGGAALAMLTVTQRATQLWLPLRESALILLCVALAASLIWSLAERVTLSLAAARLDEAAGLRERLSSSFYCLSSKDPFAQAVVADAERLSSGLSARQHIRLTYPRPLNYAGVSLLAAALCLLLPPGFLSGEEKKQSVIQTAQVEQVKTTVKKQFQDIIKKAEGNPALEDMKEDLKRLAEEPSAPLEKPDAIRHEALKKIDSLADAVKDKLNDPNYDKANELQRMLRGLKVPQETDTAAQKLTKSLSEGDFKQAQEEIKQLQDQLATLKQDEDKEMADKLSKQLEDLSKQIEAAAENKELQQKLAQAGIKPEDVKRMLENLSKQDLEQVQKALQEQGLNQQQIQQLAQQLQKQQSASQMAKQLSQAMKQASQCNSPGQAQQAAAGLSQASDQLSQLEQMQSEMDQLNSTLSDLNNAKSGMQPCPDCQGTGQKPGGT